MSTSRVGRRRIAPAALLVALLGGLHLALASALAAQPIQAGDSVRFRIPGSLRVHASTIRAAGDQIHVRTAGIDDLWTVSYFDLASLDVYRARNPQEGFRYGAAIGLGTGLFLGAGVGLLVHAVGLNESGLGGGGSEIFSTMFRFIGLGAAGGALAGGFIGGASPGTGWVRVPLPGGGKR